ncbi:MAG: AMP-binding protein [Polyangiaceae bacterium]
MRPTFPERFNLADYYLFDRLNEGLADKDAIRFGDRRFSYGRVADQTRRFAGLLMAADVRRGERVLIVLPDTPAFAWVFFGTLARGAVVAMGNPDAPFESLATLVRYTRATAIVTVPKVAEPLAQAFAAEPAAYEEVRTVLVVADVPTGGDCEGAVSVPDAPRFGALAPALAKAEPLAPARTPVVHRDEPAIWLFTSGSTGEPKANVHAHRDFAYNTEVYAKRTVGYRQSDVTVSVPRTSSSGTRPARTSCSFRGQRHGRSLQRASDAGVARRGDADVQAHRRHQRADPCSGNARVRRRGPRARLKQGSISPASASRSRRARRSRARSSHAGWSASGAGLRRHRLRRGRYHICASNRPGEVVPGSLGRPVEGYELRVLPERRGPGATPCAPGGIGVLWVRGDSASMGYWLDRGKSFHAPSSAEWCRTGDLFSIDDRGYLYCR